MRSWAKGVILLLLVGCGTSARTRPRHADRSATDLAAAAPRSRLVVLIVVDQLPSWAFAQRAPLAREGLRRLLDRGVLFSRLRFPYAATLTAVGHAALVSGAAPVRSGIVGNRHLDRASDALLPVTFDPAFPVLGVAASAALGVSPRALRVATVGDRVRERGGRVLTLSVKDRAAVMLGGRRPTLALWYDARAGRMTTSRYYAATLPGWVAALPSAQRRLPYRWVALHPELLQRWGGVDDDDDEPADHPLGRVFPHQLAQGPGASKLVEYTPVADELLTEAALVAIDQLAREPRRATADLLAVSFSTHDKVGHTWGQESWETLDVFLRLDRLLGRLLARLDRRYGADGYSVVLTSDHGATRGSGGRGPERILPETIIGAAEQAALRLLGAGHWIAAADVPYIYLARAARALPAARRAELVAQVAQSIARLPGIAFAVPSASVAGDCETRATTAAALCRAVHPQVSGEVLFGTGAHSFVSDDMQQTTSHGSLNDDDALVPLLIASPGLAPARHDEEVSVLRVAATLAKLLGTRAPLGDDQRSLLP